MPRISEDTVVVVLLTSNPLFSVGSAVRFGCAALTASTNGVVRCSSGGIPGAPPRKTIVPAPLGMRLEMSAASGPVLVSL